MLQSVKTRIKNISNLSSICPHCQVSEFVIKKGKCPRTNKQRYKCNKCQKVFVENPEKISANDYLPPNITPQEMFHYDLWDVRVLGKQPATNGQYSLNFSDINIDWLKQATKKWLWYRMVSNEMVTLQRKLETIREFARIINSHYLGLQPQEINREVVQNFIVYLSSKQIRPQTLAVLIGNFRGFIEDCQRFDWIAVTKQALVFDEDYPKNSKRLPKFIPDYVLKQIDDQLDSLARPIACMVKILRETGMRSSEVIGLNLNCIRQDSTGDWWIDIQQRKMKKEICICINRELAGVILEQQNYIIQNLSANFPYLFCKTKNHTWFRMYGTDKDLSLPREIDYFEPIAEPINAAVLRGYLYWFAQEKQIQDISGNIFPIWRLHRFRHSHATELINNGVPQHIVQKRLGHASPGMTSVYAHIHEETMKREMEKFWDGRVVNINGEVIVAENPDLDTAEMQWIKKNMKAQALPNGFCGLPITLNCPVQGSPCLICPHFRTTKEHLETHQKQLENTEKLIENARGKGWQRQIETNLPITENLKKIISGLEGGRQNA